jgi:agmatinase
LREEMARIAMSIDEKIRSLSEGTVAVIGFPLDENSSYLKGAAQGPRKIREALMSGSANMTTELGVDLGTHEGWVDLGDLELADGPRTLDAIENAVSDILVKGARVLSLGGDHSITYPILKAYAKDRGPLTILQIDAHPDTYDEYEGSRISHACPFARIMESGLAERLVQVGVRTLTKHHREQNERFGIETVEMKGWAPSELPELDGQIYLSLDLDALDPAYAPGVSHHEPGGLTTREVLDIIHQLPEGLVGADIVELNPTRDPIGMTAMVAAKFCKELVGRMLAERAQKP